MRITYFQIYLNCHCLYSKNGKSLKLKISQRVKIDSMLIHSLKESLNHLKTFFKLVVIYTSTLKSSVVLNVYSCLLEIQHIVFILLPNIAFTHINTLTENLINFSRHSLIKITKITFDNYIYLFTIKVSVKHVYR